MNTKRWIAVGITAAVVIAGLGLIKLVPFWVTLYSLISFVLGGVAGYLVKKDIIKEVIKEVPVSKKTVKKSTK